MKVIATILADLERTPMGTRSRLADDLAGEPVLRRTVRRALRAERVDSVHVLVPAEQAGEMKALIEGLDARVETHAAGPAPYVELVRAARWWSLDGWRGGIGGACCFDEDTHVPLISALAEREGADAVVSIPAGAAVIDPELIDAIVDRYVEMDGAVRLTFVQAPPGIGPFLMGRGLLDELAPTGQPPGVLLAYRPDQPQADLTGKEACYRPNAAIMEARGRMICDTHRSFERVAALLAAGGESWDARRVCRWMGERAATHVDDVPEEIEIELTTEDPATGAILRPRGAAVGRRGPITREAVAAIIESIGEYDDVRIVLGGFGEPTCHPEFTAICQSLRESPAAAIAVRTHAMIDDDAAEQALFETPVDVIEVTLDAATAATHAAVYGVDRYEEVAARVDRWVERRVSSGAILPLIIPTLVKSVETAGDMEAFFDGWMRRTGMVALSGYSHRAGQCERRAVTSLEPPMRGPCRRVFSRALVLADGCMVTCDEDFAGRQTVGATTDQPLRELWRGECLNRIRTGDDGLLPLCPTCDEWHRP